MILNSDIDIQEKEISVEEIAKRDERESLSSE